MVAGLAQITIGSHIPGWSGHKRNPVALGLLTIVLGATGLAAAQPLRASAAVRSEMLVAIGVWLAAVGVLCSTTVGRLWVIPGMLLLGAASVTFAMCGWNKVRSVVAAHWLRGLLGVLGVFELLMAVSAAPARNIVAGLVAGSALIAAAVLSRPTRRMVVPVFVVATTPFALSTWWTIVTPLITVVALAIGFAITAQTTHSIDAGLVVASRSGSEKHVAPRGYRRAQRR